MTLLWALTLWGLFAVWLLFQAFELPRRLIVAPMVLLTAELVALGFWSYGSANCLERPCGTLAEVGRTAASVDIPLIGLAVIMVAALRGARRHHARVCGSSSPARAARSEPRRSSDSSTPAMPSPPATAPHPSTRHPDPAHPPTFRPT
jgi:hypothetical protein